MQNNDNTRKLYDALVADNYELGDYEKFTSDISNPEYMRKLYDTMVADDYELGEYNTFSSRYSVTPQGNAAQATQATVQPVQPTETPSLLNMGVKPKDYFAEAGAKAMDNIRQERQAREYQEIMKPYTSSFGSKKEHEFINTIEGYNQATRIFGGEEANRRRDELNEQARPWMEAQKTWTPSSARRFREQTMEQTWYDPYAVVPEEYKALATKQWGKEGSEDAYFSAWMNLTPEQREAFIKKEHVKSFFNEETTSKMQGIRERATTYANNALSEIPVSVDPRYSASAMAARTVNNIGVQTTKALDKAEEIKQAYKNHQLDENFFAGAYKGMKDGLTDIDNWTGIYMIGEITNLYDIADKMEKGEELTQTEEDFLDAQAYKLAVEAALADDLGWGYKSGNVTGASVPFMLQMLASPIGGASGKAIDKGFAAVGRRAIDKFGKGILKKLLTKAPVKKVAKGLVGTVGKGIGQTILFGSDRVAAGTMQRHLGNEMVAERANEEFNAGVQAKAGEDWGTALFKEGVSASMENISEFAGGAFIDDFTKMVGKKISKEFMDAMGGSVGRRMANAAARQNANKVFRAIANNKWGQHAVNISKSVQNGMAWDGLLNEYLEEVLNNAANVMIGDMSVEDFTSLEKNAETILGLAWTSGFFTANSAVNRVGGYIRGNIALKRTDRAARQIFTGDMQEKWNAYTQALSQANGYEEVEQLYKGLIADISNNQDKETARAQITEATAYMTNYVKMMGMNAATEEDEEEEPKTPAQQEVESAQGEGIAAHGTERELDVVEEMDQSYNQLAEHLGETNVEDWLLQYGETADKQLEAIRGSELDEQTKAMADTYLTSAQRYEGLLLANQEEVDAIVDEAAKEFDANVNQELGSVIQVLTTQDKVAYVIQGNPNEREQITLRYNDGSMEQASSKVVEKVLSESDAQAIRGDMLEGVRKSAIAEIVTRMQGIVPNATQMQMPVGHSVVVDGQAGVVAGVNEDGTMQIQMQGGNAVNALPQQVMDAQAYNDIMERKARAREGVTVSAPVREEAEVPVSEEAATETVAAVEEMSEAQKLLQEYMDESVSLEDRQAIVENNVAQAKQTAMEAQAEFDAMNESKPNAKDYTNIAEFKQAQEQWKAQMQEKQQLLDLARQQEATWNEVQSGINQPVVTEETSEQTGTEATPATPQAIEDLQAEAKNHNSKHDIKALAKEIGVSAKRIQRVIDFANQIGVKLNFANVTRTEGDKGAFTNADNMSSKREITMSKYMLAKGMAIEWVMGHELTHQIKADGNAAQWETYKQTIINALGQETFDKRVKTQSKIYSMAGAYKNMPANDFIETMEEEVCADAAGDMLLNPDNMNKVMGVPQSLASRIWSALKDMVTFSTPSKIKQAVDAWQQLAEGKEIIGQNTERKYSVTNKNNQFNEHTNEEKIVSLQQKTREYEHDQVARLSGEGDAISTLHRTTSPDSGTDNRAAEKTRPSGGQKESLLGSLVRRAKEDETWIKDIRPLVGRFISSAGEHEVFFSRKGDTVIKLNDFEYLPENSTDFTSFINRIESFNELFPDVAVTVVGYTYNSEGKVSVVLEQPVVDAEREATEAEIDAFMEDHDFYMDMSGEYTDGRYVVYDLKPNNVYVDKSGSLRFFDALVFDESRAGGMLTIPHDIKKRKKFVAPYQEDPTAEPRYSIISVNEEIANDKKFSIANRNQEIFVSNAARAVEDIKQEKATPQQWLAMIEKNGGLKAGEDKWLGLSDWLKGIDKKSVTKQEILDFIGENMIQIEEVEYGDIENNSRFKELNDEFRKLYYEYDHNGDAAFEEMVNRYGEDFGLAFSYSGDELWVEDTFGSEAAEYFLGVRSIDATRREYTTDGLDNKQEIALVVPTIESWNQSDIVHFGDAGDGRAVAWVRFGETTSYETIEDVQVVNEFQEPYKNFNGMDVYRPVGNFGRGDYVVHGKGRGGNMIYVAYINDKQLPVAHATLEDARNALNEYYKEHPRKLKKTNRVLVIDEIQSKRHQEGREKGYESKEQKDADRGLKEYADELKEKYGARFYTSMLPEERVRYNELSDIANNVQRGQIPDAPFDKNWHELAMKRMLRYAAENGYDKVAWTKGAQQAERYDLAKVLDEIAYWKEGDGLWGISAGDRNDTQKIDQQTFTEKELVEYFGKEIANKIVNDEGSEESVLGYPEESNVHFLNGESITVGGEGMKGFYDKMLPSFMGKYGKKWGAKVGEVTLPDLEESAQHMWAVDITPEMKESVMQGQVMFSINDNNVASYIYNMDATRAWMWVLRNSPKGVRAKGYGYIDKDRLEEFQDWYDSYLDWGAEEYIQALEELKNKATKKAQEYIDEVIAGVEKHKDDFRRLAEGDDSVLSTSNAAKFSISAEEQSIIDAAKADGTHMKAPNGEPTNLNEKQWAQVRTQAFKDWFGDWENDPENASKVVDGNGEPMVVYHGSEEDFNVFDKTKGRANMDIQGMFFSPWDDDARGYGRNVRAFYLNIRKPANESTGYKALKSFQGLNGAGIKAREYLVSVGYDGLNNEGQEFVAFDSNQIKSATDNVGTFDAENADIRYSMPADILAANERFNEELDEYIKKGTKANFIFHIGQPLGIMKLFFPELPIVMRPRVINKASNTKHDVGAASLYNLPQYIAEPIFVFQREDGAIGILTEMMDNNGKNVCVAVELNKKIQDGGTYLDVNDIRSIHGRDVKNIVLPIIHNNTLKYADKEKALDWFSSASSIYQQEITSQELSDVTKIVQDFQNPPLPVDESSQNIENAKSGEQKYSLPARPAIPRRNEGESIMDYAQRVANATEAQRAWDVANKTAMDIDRQMKNSEEYRDILAQKEPQTIEEAASIALASGKLLWNDHIDGTKVSKGVKSMMGWSEGERRSFFAMFASKENGGVSVEQMGEGVIEICHQYNIPVDDTDAMVGVNALLEVLQSAEKPSDITGYIEHNRIEQVRRMIEEEQELLANERNKAYMDIYGMTYDDFVEIASTIDTEDEQERIDDKNVIAWLYGQSQRQQERITNAQAELEQMRNSGVAKAQYDAAYRALEQMKAEAKQTQAKLDEVTRELSAAKGQATRLKKANMRYKEQKGQWKQVYKELRKAINGKNIRSIDKNTLNGIMRAVGSADLSGIKLFGEAGMIEDIILGVNMRAVQDRIDKLLATKTTALNDKGIATGKSVDASVQAILANIRKTLEGILHHDIENQIHDLRSQNWHIRHNALGNLSQEQQEQIDANKAKIEELKAELSRELATNTANTEQAVNEQIDKLTEQIDMGLRTEEESAELMTTLALKRKMVAIHTSYQDTAPVESLLRRKKSELRKIWDALHDDNTPQDKREEYRQKRKALQEQIAGLKAQVREGRRATLDAMQAFADSLEETITTGRTNLKGKMQEQLQRRKEFVAKAIHDVNASGKQMQSVNEADKQENDKLPWYKRMFSPALRTFDYMLQKIATRTYGKDSWLYRQFMLGENGVMAAHDEYLRGMQTAARTLEDKAMEIFGKSYQDVMAESNRKKDIGIEILRDAEDYEPSYIPLKLTKGQATYIYMLWRMRDGYSKLATQGFTEEIMQRIEEYIGPDYIQWADWVQMEYLPMMREKYNARYREIYDTNMAAIDNYVPIRIHGQAIRKEVDLTDATASMPGMQKKNGALIQRTVNVNPIDISNNIFELIGQHIDEMEEFYAYAPVRRDLQYILSSPAFRNLLNTQEPGTFQSLLEAARIATKTNQQPESAASKAFNDILNKLQKGLVSGNIAYRNMTAIKQVLSAPAFIGYSQSPEYLGILAKNMLGGYLRNLPTMAFPLILGIGHWAQKMTVEETAKGMPYIDKFLGETFRWCMREFPDFRERVTRGSAGDIRLEEKGFSKLLDKYTELGMSANVFIDAVTVSVGLKSIYDYEMAKAAKRISKMAEEMQMDKQWTEEEMRKASNAAKIQATLFANQTQQSSNPALLSPMQVSKNFMERSLTLYKNSSLGLMRAGIGGMRNLLRFMKGKKSRRRMIEEYTRMFMQEGFAENEAKKRAISYVNSEARKGAFVALLEGYAMNVIWNLGSKGLLGFMAGGGDDDDKERTIGEWIWDGVKHVIKNTFGSAMPFVNDALDGRLPVIGLTTSEAEKAWKDIKKQLDENGISLAFALTGMRYAAKFGGVDMQVWANTMDGYYRLFSETGNSDDNTLALMLILNSPHSNRMAVARELYKGKSEEEFQRAIELAGRYNQPVWTFGREMTNKVESDMAAWYLSDNATEEEKQRMRDVEEMEELIDNLETVEDALELFDEVSDTELRKKISNKIDQMGKPEDTFAEKVARKKKNALAEDDADMSGYTYMKMADSQDLLDEKRLRAEIDMLSAVVERQKELFEKHGSESEIYTTYMAEHGVEIRRYHALQTYHGAIQTRKRKMDEEGADVNALYEKIKELYDDARNI